MVIYDDPACYANEVSGRNDQMGRRLNTDHDKPFRFTTCFTNDAVVPHYFGSDIACDGWRSIPMPPADPAKEDWKILCRTNAATRWYRICRDFWATARLGAAGRVIARVLQIKAPNKPEG
jgi:hypothetical protein